MNLCKEIDDQFSELVKNDKQKRLFIKFVDPDNGNHAIFGHEILTKWVTGLTKPFFNWAWILLPHMAEEEQKVTSHRHKNWFVIESDKIIVVLKTLNFEEAYDTILEELIGLLLNIENFIVCISYI